jgi:hypothetical protein
MVHVGEDPAHVHCGNCGHVFEWCAVVGSGIELLKALSDFNVDTESSVIIA